jgi:hypothetical protein
MIFRYVNLSKLGFGGSGYTQASPLNKDAFFHEISSPSYYEDNEDVTYYISGCYSNDMCGTDEQHIVMNINKLNIDGTKSRNIYLKSYYNGEPWKLINTKNDGDIVIILGNSGNVNSLPNNIILQNGIIETKQGSIYLISESNSSCIVDSFFSKANGTRENFYLPYFKNIDIKNTSIISHHMYFNENQNVKLRNSIVDSWDFTSDLNSLKKYIEIDNVVFSRDIDEIEAKNNMFFTGNYQDNWEPPTIWQQTISGQSKEDWNYLSSAFNTITISGNKTIGTTIPWTGKRDGVGFFYFPKLKENISISPLSGYHPLEVTVNFNGILTSASKVNISWRDGTENNYTSGTSATHTFFDDGVFKLFSRCYSKNNWYDFCSALGTVNVYDSEVVSAGIVVLNINNEIISEGFENNYYILSATNLFGKIVSYEFETSKGVFSGYNINGFSEIFKNIFYDIGSVGTEIVYLTLNSNLPNEFQTNISFNILENTSGIFYVDLNSENDGDGTSSSAFNFLQFKERIKYGGKANVNDIYKLKGYKFIQRDLTVKRPFNVFNIDYRKNIIIDVWDASLYGPWMISTIDDYYFDNIILDFKGCTLKNGIIYNQPQKNGLDFYGGKIEITNLYNMWIVNQGKNSEISFVPTISGSNIMGSTIYCENKINNNEYLTSGLDYNILIQDSVFNNFDLRLENFNNSNFIVNNSCFGNTSAIFIDVENVLTDCQFELEYDQDWPLTVNNKNYNKDIDWLNLNKNDFLPFDNINSPPNPGYAQPGSTPEYHLYEYGLWGFLRNLYGS